MSPATAVPDLYGPAQPRYSYSLPDLAAGLEPVPPFEASDVAAEELEPTILVTPTKWSAQLSREEMVAVYAEAGVPAEWVEPLLAIAWCESRYSPGAVGDGSNSLGLHQLWTGWFREGEDPFDPVTNARVALRVRETRGRFGGGGGWTCADLLGIW